MVSENEMTKRARTVGRHTVLLIYSIISLFPIYWSLSMSLKTGSDIVSVPPEIVFEPSLRNYIVLFQQNDFLSSLLNSLVSVSASVVLVLLIGVPAAYAISRFDFPREPDLLIWILSSRMLPPVAVVIPFFILYRTLNIYDTILGLTIMYLTINISIVVWVMKAIFDNLPPSLEEAAMVDGATRIQAFVKVVLPSAKSGIVASAVISFIFAWIDLLFALVLTSSQASTAPLTLLSFIGSRSIDYGMLAAASTIVFLPVLLFIVLMNGYLATGLSFGVTTQD